MAYLQNIIPDVNQIVDAKTGEEAANDFIVSQAANNLIDHAKEHNTGATSSASQADDNLVEHGNESNPNTAINHRYDRLHPDVRPYAMMTRTCYMDFDPMSTKAKLPPVFARVVSPLIGNSVFLEDKNRNEIQVSVERKNGKIYFTDGWSRLRDFYGLSVGGWITLLYITPLFFNIRVRRITGIEVDYPSRIPPYRLLLTKTLGGGSSNGPIPFFVLPKFFYHRLEKTLTSSDVESGTLMLFWRGFCELAFPQHDTQLTFIDWLGNIWTNCNLQIGTNSDITCKISGGWRDICKMHRLAEGITVKFGVTQEANNTVVYFKLDPFLGVRTTMFAPSTSGKRKVFYQTQQYYML